MALRVPDVTGQRFGALVIVRHDGTDRRGTLWLANCDCGLSKTVTDYYLHRVQIPTCGGPAHGAVRDPVRAYARKSYDAMMRRCYVERAKDYAAYGAAGIRVCRRWADSFETFLEDMGPRPRGTSIGRIRGDLGYWCGTCPECADMGRVANCRWETATQQSRNTTRNLFVEIDGEIACVSEWCQRLGKSTAVTFQRIKNGWDPAKAILTPWVRRPRRCSVCGVDGHSRIKCPQKSEAPATHDEQPGRK